MSEIIPVPLGDSALLWSWPGGINRDTSRRVLAVYRAFRDDRELRALGMVDVVPSYCAVAVHCDPDWGDLEAVRRRAEQLLKASEAGDTAGRETSRAPVAGEAGGEPAWGSVPGATAVHRLPVVYDGPDLEHVARWAGVQPRGVVELHLDAEYTVAMIGFRPHFPYLIGMDQRIATPRLETPRKDVPAGSVGIAGEQTGVYPVNSPGGWNLIGRTDPELLFPIRPGDTVVFEEEV